MSTAAIMPSDGSAHVRVDSLLPSLFTPIARSRLWRPFGDAQRIAAARMLTVHLTDALRARRKQVLDGNTDPALRHESFALTTQDRLATDLMPQTHLLSLMRTTIPNDHLLLIAYTLMEFSIDRYLAAGIPLNFGNLSISSSTAHGESAIENINLVTKQLQSLGEVLATRRFITRHGFLRRISYQLEWLSVTRLPMPYSIVERWNIDSP
jgi:hypothetical protein